MQKQPPRGVPWKRCSENMQQIYRRTLMPKCDFNFIEITFQHGCSPVNLLHIFRISFLKNTSWWLLLIVEMSHPLSSLITFYISLSNDFPTTFEDYFSLNLKSVSRISLKIKLDSFAIIVNGS